MFEIYFSHDKDIWVAVTDDCIYFCIIVCTSWCKIHDGLLMRYYKFPKVHFGEKVCQIVLLK